MAGAFRVRGYREFLQATNRAGKKSRAEVRAALRTVAEPVRQDAIRRFSVINARSAAGYRTSVTTRGVSVRQSLRKTTGKHPEYGALQMRRALLPALRDQEPKLEAEMEKALDRIADHFDK